jgi:hypothetical protein
MGKDTKSRTGRDSFVEERIASALVGGDDHHYKTDIDGVTGRGRTSEESQKVASDKYHNRK